jgi:signal transduction histidine kinase
MLKQTLRLLLYLLASLVTGIVVTLAMDSFENVAVEKRIRKGLEQEVRAAAAAFKNAAAHPSSGQVLLFVREYAASALKGKVIAVDPVRDAKPNASAYASLFTYREPGGEVDFYIVTPFLKNELAVLDLPELAFGLFTTVIVFTFITFFTEKRKQVRALRQQFEVKHAEIRKVLEEHEALALLGRMAATLAHELKTPIATISNLVQILPSRLGDQQFTTRFVALTREELHRTEQLISNLLAYGKEIEIGRDEWIPLASFVAELAARNALRADVPPYLEVSGDRFYLGLLFENLLRNSRVAGADAVRLTLLTSPAGADVSTELLLEDNGRGFLPDAELDTLLAPFVTLRSSGAGLGLYLAAKIAAAHGGAISLYRPQQGAGVRLVLPRKRVRHHEQP